jgi:hypothetical protein
VCSCNLRSVGVLHRDYEILVDTLFHLHRGCSLVYKTVTKFVCLLRINSILNAFGKYMSISLLWLDSFPLISPYNNCIKSLIFAVYHRQSCASGGGGAPTATQPYFCCDHIKGRGEQAGSLVLYVNIDNGIIASVKQTKMQCLTRELSVAMAITLCSPSTESNKLGL